MTSKSQFSIRLINLHCFRQDEKDGDEVFLKINDKKVWPTNDKYVKLNEGVVHINLVLSDYKSDNLLTIELWDYDLLSPNDLLGKFEMLVDEKGGPFSTDLTVQDSNMAKYSIEWEVF